MLKQLAEATDREGDLTNTWDVKIERVAREEGVSLNQSVQKLLRRGLAHSEDEDESGVTGNSLDHLIGTWTAEEADEFDRAVADFEVIDESMWE